METMAIRMSDTVVEFIFGQSRRIVFGYEDRPGLEIGRDKRSQKVVAYMSLSFPLRYRQILKGLKENPVLDKFSVASVEECGNATLICDPRVKNASFAEIVQWVWEKYYAPLEEQRAVAASTPEHERQLNKRATTPRPSGASVNPPPLQPR